MNLDKNVPYYILGIFLFLVFKLGFKYANHEDLIFLIKPTDTLISSLTGSTSVYIENEGYYNNHLDILIDKSCAGFNFWVLSFLMIMFLLLKYAKSHLQRIASIPVALLFTFVLTIIVNTSRIYVLIVAQNRLSSLLSIETTVIHESIGILINLSFLIITYLMLEKIIIKYKNHAKFA
ncbi:exosortase K [uncultured Aquimarina sp.]|uniref:exosortase K n=1 Tax=uncultured Aquimarina sp. TaxID=575652 RepID=UPI00345169BD